MSEKTTQTIAQETATEISKKPIGVVKMHTMPEKFLNYLSKGRTNDFGNKIGARNIGLKKNLIVGGAIALAIILAIGLAAWFFIKSINNKPADDNLISYTQNLDNNAPLNNLENQNNNNENDSQCLAETCLGCSLEQCKILSGSCQIKTIQEPDSITGQITIVEICAPVVIEQNLPETPTSTPENLPDDQDDNPTDISDSDNDGLSDEEERVWGTDQGNSDSDNDSYNDGTEIENLYDPMKGSDTKLLNSDMAKQWVDSENGYSVLYPSSFAFSQKDDESGATFTDNITGQFFQITFLENESEALTIEDWYMGIDSAFDLSLAKRAQIGGLDAIEAGQNSWYVLVQGKICLVDYNSGYPLRPYFSTSFKGFLKSLNFFSNPY
jgi:hypothetical protein